MGASTSAIDLAYTEYNESATKSLEPPVIIAHCVMGNRKHWDAAATFLASRTGRIVYCLDLRDHGESPNMTDSDMKDYASDIEKFVRDKNLKRCHFIGHSLGGKILLILAFEKPHFFESLILVDYIPIEMPKFFSDYMLYTLRALGEILLVLNKTGANLQEAIDTCEQELRKNKIRPASFRKILSESLIIVNGRYEYSFNLKHMLRRSQRYIDFDFEGQVFPGPTLVVAIEKSVFVTPEGLKDTAEMLPNRTVVEIPNASHQIQIEKPQELVEECVKFWRNLKQ